MRVPYEGLRLQAAHGWFYYYRPVCHYSGGPDIDRGPLLDRIACRLLGHPIRDPRDGTIYFVDSDNFLSCPRCGAYFDARPFAMSFKFRPKMQSVGPFR